MSRIVPTLTVPLFCTKVPVPLLPTRIWFLTSSKPLLTVAVPLELPA